MKRIFFIIIIISGLLLSCSNNSKYEIDDSGTYITRKSKKTERVMGSYSGVFSDNPTVNKLYGKGSRYMKREKYRKAKPYFLEVLSIEPNNIHALNTLGIIEMRLHNFDQSEKHLKKVIEIEPAFSHSYIKLGLSYYYNDEFLKGISILKSMDYSNADNAVLSSNYFHLFMNYTRLYSHDDGYYGCDSAFHYYQYAIRTSHNELLRENIELFKKHFFDYRCSHYIE
jgi:tetratricopeptide (TPR) repeat protein